MLNEALEKKKQFLKDVQSEQDSRNIPLKHVGISDLRWPLVLRDRQKGEQHTVATVSVAVDLPIRWPRYPWRWICRKTCGVLI